MKICQYLCKVCSIDFLLYHLFIQIYLLLLNGCVFHVLCRVSRKRWAWKRYRPTRLTKVTCYGHIIQSSGFSSLTVVCCLSSWLLTKRNPLLFGRYVEKKADRPNVDLICLSIFRWGKVYRLAIRAFPFCRILCRAVWCWTGGQLREWSYFYADRRPQQSTHEYECCVPAKVVHFCFHDHPSLLRNATYAELMF